MKKAKQVPGAAPAPQPEMEQCQALQEGQDHIQEQDRARGRLGRAAQKFLKFFGIRHKKTRTTPPEVLAQCDTVPPEVMAKPDVGTTQNDGTAAPVTDGTPNTDSTDGTPNTDSPMTDDTEICAAPRSAGTASGDMALTHKVTNADPTLPDQPVEDEAARTEGVTNTSTTPALCLADVASLGFPVQERLDTVQVSIFVKKLDQTLVANKFPEPRLLLEFLRVADAHPVDVALTLLSCAPSCNRAAALMWRNIALCESGLEKVLPVLLCVMEHWPQHSMSTSDGHNKHIFALAATRVVWEILQIARCPEPVIENSPRLVVALLSQVLVSTEQMPEEVNSFWRRCSEEHGLATNPSRFAMQTVRALLCHLKLENLVVAVERKHGWDTLLNRDTHHYAVGLLAREMRRVSSPLCSRITLCLLGLLSRNKPHWDLPALAFLVEVLDCLDMKEYGDSILYILSRNLQGECPHRRLLALRGLVGLTNDPVMAEGLRSLTQSLLELLEDADGELVATTLSVFLNEVTDRDIKITIPTALQLAVALQPLFDSDNTQVQLLSIRLFRKVMELVVDEGKEPLQKHVTRSLLPLFFRWHDEDQRVAEASRDALICVAKFLRRTDLLKALKMKQPLTFSECLLAKDRSQAAETLRQVLPYLGSHQEPVREAALRVTGIAMGQTRGEVKELQLICQALQVIRKNDRPSYTSDGARPLEQKAAPLLSSSPGSRQSVLLRLNQIPDDRRPEETIVASRP